MLRQLKELEIERCPHCRVDTPSMLQQTRFDTNDHRGDNSRVWVIYVCQRCGGVVLTGTYKGFEIIQEIYPDITAVDEVIPKRAREYLQQAIDSLHAPAGSIMLSSSAVDAMLKAKGYKEGSLYSRIEQAQGDHLITSDMAQWPHEVRLDANFQRHADNSEPLPNPDDAKRAVDFALALGEFLFILPSRVKRGLAEAKKESEPEGDAMRQAESPGHSEN